MTERGGQLPDHKRNNAADFSLARQLCFFVCTKKMKETDKGTAWILDQVEDDSKVIHKY